MAQEKQKIPEEIQKLSFEEAMKKLEAIVERLESGNVNLEESIKIYTEGNFLKTHCQAKLRDAEAKIEKIRLSEDGGASGAEPFDPEEN